MTSVLLLKTETRTSTNQQEQSTMDLPKKSLSDRLSPSFQALLADSGIVTAEGDVIEYASQLPTYVQQRIDIYPESVEIDELGPVKSLVISCQRIPSFHAFSTLIDLYLHNHTGEIGLEHLKDISIVRFGNCHNLVDLTPLRNGRMRRLSLNDCDNIVDLPPLSHLDSISIESCQGIVDVSPLRVVRKVLLEYSNSISGVSCLEGGKTRQLHIEGCERIRDVASLINTLDTLTLYACSEKIQRESLRGGKVKVTFLDSPVG